MRNLSMSQQSINIKGSYNDVIHHRLYFGTSGGGASTIAAAEYRIWANGVGQQEANISTGSTVTLKECDTSLSGENGIIPNGANFVVNAIGISVQVSNIQATTPFTDNSVTSINVTPVVQSSPIPLIEALSSQCTFELYRNSDERLERGVINEYPCEFANQGVAGGGAATVPALAAGAQATYTVNPTVVWGTNGMMFRKLSVFHIFEQLDQFYGILKVNRPIDLGATKLTGHIDFYLVGKANINYNGQELVASYS